MTTLVDTRPGSVFGRAAELVLTSDDADQTMRWTPGDRLHHVFEQRCDALRADDPARLAVGRADLALTYADLDVRANRLARFLRRRGVRAGDRVGLVFDEPVRSYVGMLAVLKLHAAYVPLDAGFPPDRLAYICADARVAAVLTTSPLGERLAGCGVDVLCLDEVDALVDAENPGRPTEAETGPPVDDLCYVIYTSGTTGRPKGVAIEHASICNFVRVAAEVYGVRPTDRMYQGMTIAFDFSVEEIWVALTVGATLVPRPSGPLLGDDLARFLREEHVTALCCVPTLLATMTDDLPELRFLLVSGEACPQDLVARWYRPERRFLNVYGPTEATVTATWTTLHPDRFVTIGVPLPTYAVVILDEHTQRPLPPGGIGEIGIAGICLARGYLNRDDLTAKAFLEDVPGLPPGRVYRTGDLGRITGDGLVECLGRIDTQVKIRGYRIELTEIESVLLAVPGVAQAVVDTHEPERGVVELVAYFTAQPGEAVDVDGAHEILRDRLPRYMLPAYYEQLGRIPTLPSDKADRKALPPPSRPRHTSAQGAHVPPAGPVEEALAVAVAALLGLDRVSVEAHFFDELGLTSLLMAQLCTLLRERPALPPVAMRDLYLHPTVRGLAAVLQDRAPGAAGAAPRSVRTASTAAYVACGAVQAACYLAAAYLLAGVVVTSYDVLTAATGPLDTYLRAVGLVVAVFGVTSLLPVAAKWLLVGRWKPAVIPVWSRAYLRFWVVRQLARATPMRLFVGSSLYLAYLRAFGARIGRGAVVLTRNVPVCTDLLSIGPGAIVRKDAFLIGFRAESGWIRIGGVRIGARAVVGEATVLDVDTSLGDDAQLGHSSSLHAGQHVPAGRRYHGSPAQETDTDYRMVRGRDCGRVRRASYSAFQLAMLLLVSGPLVLIVLFVVLPMLVTLLFAGAGVALDQAGPGLLLGYLAFSSTVFLGLVAVRLALVVTVPRLIGRFVQPGRTFRLYGLRYMVHRAVARLSNSALFNDLLGDSSFVVGFLRLIGYDLRPVLQTGSNFGLAVRHEAPGHVRVGTGTLVSDGLSLVNADYSSSSFAVSRVTVGAHSFLGNDIVYPAQSVVGDDCLLATKVMVPIDGPVREGVGLLGSPPFEIPRTRRRDARVEGLLADGGFRRQLARKNRSNLATMGAFLLQRCLLAYGVLLLVLVVVELDDRLGLTAWALGVVATLAYGTLLAIVVERMCMGFRRLRPRSCSIYEPYYWRHERLWKLSRIGFLGLFNGTPFKGVVWRLYGVRVGRMLYDDGAVIPEKTLVEIGDGCTVNVGATIQCHSLEDANFTSDHVVIGSGCTLGPRTFVHYGVHMADRTALDPDAFLMKGSMTAPDSHWGGNPAREVGEPEPLAAHHGPGRGGRCRRPRSVLAVPAAGALLVAIQAALTAVTLPTGAAEARLVDAAFAALNPTGAPPDGIGLDGVVARMQLSAYAAVTGSFERYPTVLGGARELGLVACVVLLAALVALARSLGVRPLAAAAGLGALALCPPAMAAMTTFGPGLLGAAWLTAGAALLARGRTWLWLLGAPAVLLGIASAPVLAVLVLVISAAVVVTVRVRRRGPSLLGVAVLAAALPLALLPPPGGEAAVPALVALVVLVGLVLLDEAITRLLSGSVMLRRGGLAALAAVPVAALVVVLLPASRTVSDAVGAVDGAPALATWLAEATDPATGVAAAPGVWSDLLRAGVPVNRLQPQGALAVTAVGAGSGPVVAQFGAGRGAVQVSRAQPEGEPPAAGIAGRAATALADNPDLAAPDDVRAVLRSGAVDPRAVTVLVGLAARGPVELLDVPVVPGEDAAAPRHRVVVADADADAKAWLAAQALPYAPLVSTEESEVTLTWPLPA
jgi:non-ribosomal peptide synthetase-like protein